MTNKEFMRDFRAVLDFIFGDDGYFFLILCTVLTVIVARFLIGFIAHFVWNRFMTDRHKK